jgi:hypothetical protein
MILFMATKLRDSPACQFDCKTRLGKPFDICTFANS